MNVLWGQTGAAVKRKLTDPRSRSKRRRGRL